MSTPRFAALLVGVSVAAGVAALAAGFLVVDALIRRSVRL